RSDPRLRRSNPASTQLALLVEDPVVRQHKVRAIAHQQILVDLDSQFTQTLDLTDQRHRIDHNAVSNHADFAAPQNSRRDEMQNIFDAAIDDGVAGIIAALTAYDDIGPSGKHVDDLAFALVAPLHANQNCVRH